MRVAVANNSQVENYIKFLELNNGKIISIEVRRIEFDPFNRTIEIKDENIKLKSSYSDDGLLLCDKWLISKNELKTIWVYKDSLCSFVTNYRNDKDGIFYEIYIQNSILTMFDMPRCTDFFDDDKDFKKEYMEVQTRWEREALEENDDK